MKIRVVLSVFSFSLFITFQIADNMVGEVSRNNSVRSGYSSTSMSCGSEAIGFMGRLNIYILKVYI